MAKKPRLDFEKPYDAMKDPFSSSPMSDLVTRCFAYAFETSRDRLEHVQRLPLLNATSDKTKSYFCFYYNGKYSRPVNGVLYDGGIRFALPLLRRISTRQVSEMSASEITAATYAIATSFCCATDIFSGSGVKQSGTFFERLIGHMMAVQFGVDPRGAMTTNELDGEKTVIPTDFIFDLGARKPKFHVPVKTSTRERVVQVWAQQRVLDGAYGVGRFHCLLTCISETELDKKDKDRLRVIEVCLPGQWTIYQLYIAQLTRIYYLDVPKTYYSLNESYPRIHVKPFGEFFHELDSLNDL